MQNDLNTAMAIANVYVIWIHIENMNLKLADAGELWFFFGYCGHGTLQLIPLVVFGLVINLFSYSSYFVINLFAFERPAEKHVNLHR